MATIYEIRRDNLRLLINERGNNEVAKATGYSSASYLSQMAGKKPTRTVTEQTARKVEQALALPAYWLDVERDLYGNPVTRKSVPPVGAGAKEAHPPLAVASQEEFQLIAAAVSNAMVSAGVKLPKDKYGTIIKMLMVQPERDEALLEKMAEELVALAG